MTREDLLAIWRANLDEIERRIAEYGGESKAPLELIHLRDRARREIAALESDTSEDALRSGAERRLTANADYALVEVERLRRDLAAWQAGVGKELLELTEQHVRPVEQIVFSVNARLDALNESIRQMDVRLSVLTQRVETMRGEIERVTAITRDVDRIKGAVGINGDASVERLPKHIYWWMVLLSGVTVAIGMAMVMLLVR